MIEVFENLGRTKMKEKIVSVLTFVKKWIVFLWNQIKKSAVKFGKWVKGHKIYFFALLVFAIVPLFFLDHLYEFPALIFPLYGIDYVGIGVWIAFGKPFWQTAIACGCAASFSLILLYFGFDVGKNIFSFFRRKKKKESAPPKKKNGFFKKAIDWLSKKGLIGVIISYFLCLIPLVPFFIPIAVIFPLAQKVKYAMPILMIFNFLRATIVTAAVYLGFRWIFINFGFSGIFLK